MSIQNLIEIYPVVVDIDRDSTLDKNGGPSHQSVFKPVSQRKVIFWVDLTSFLEELTTVAHIRYAFTLVVTLLNNIKI